MRVRRRVKLLSLCITLAVAGFSLSSGAQISALTSSPMLDCSGLPCVDVTVGDNTHLKMLVDTGNEASMLDKVKAEAMGLELKPIKGPDGKPYPGYSLATVKNVRLGGAPLGDVKLLVADLKSSIQKGEYPPADGSLSYTAFHGRILQMDYKDRHIGVSELLKSDEPCPSFCGTITHPTFGKQGPPIVVTTGFQLNGKDVAVQIDTLYSGTMLIYSTSVEKLGLSEQQNAAKKRVFPFTDGGVEMIEGTALAESFGTKELKRDVAVYFATPKVHQPDGMFDGTVGHELFAGHVLTLDFHAHRFWMA
jgi:Aspartyl protease